MLQVVTDTGGQAQIVGRPPVILHAQRKGARAELGCGIVCIQAWNGAGQANPACSPRLEVGNRVEVDVACRPLQEQVEHVDLGVTEQRFDAVFAEIKPRSQVNREILGVELVGLTADVGANEEARV